jgi:hypothetical protein
MSTVKMFIQCKEPMTPIPDNILKLAKECNAKTKIPVSVILSQWILETGAFKSNLFRYCYNLAGIKYHGAYTDSNGFSCYPTLEVAASDWVRTINLGYYNNVRNVCATSDNIEQMFSALGESPWDAGHYNNGKGPGSSLLALYKADNLAVFDLLPDVQGNAVTTQLVVGQPIEYYSSDVKYYIKPEYAGKSIEQINNSKDYVLGRADILAGFLGVKVDSPLEASQVYTANKFPKAYVPNSSEWKGFLEIMTTTQEVPQAATPTPTAEETPAAVEEKKPKLEIASLYLVLLLALDSILTKIRLAIKFRCPEAK